MGNCLASNTNTVSKTVLDKKHVTEKRFPVGSSKVEPSSRLEGGRRKMVAFRLRGDDINGNDEEINSTGQAVRIRIVVTKEELKQILRYREDLKSGSVEQLPGVSRWRDRRRIHEVGASSNQIANGNWKPALKSVPEEH